MSEEFKESMTLTINSAEQYTIKQHLLGPEAFYVISEIKDFLRNKDKYGLNAEQLKMTPEELIAWVRESVISIINDRFCNDDIL